MAVAAPLPGGTLDPTTISKYATELVIPPVMPASTTSPTPVADYDIAVRQFQQQILPAPLPPTTVWSYGRAQDVIPPGFVAPVPVASGVSFNYPAFTVETASAVPTSVRWINDLVADPTACAASVDKTIAACSFLPHLFKVDQTMHWANPPKANCAMGLPNRTDCETMLPDPYLGPVPLVTHVHGSHVQPHSDGYPQAWWLPGAPGNNGIPATYGERGMDFTQADNTNTVPGSAYYSYSNDQPATTLWYHDHALGMTRLNVYAGPAGFWLVRGGANSDSFVDNGTTGALNDGLLPGPAPSGANDPNFDPIYRGTIREVPLAIQDRSFNSDGSLFYPADRAFFDGYTGPFIGDMSMPPVPSDMSPIWNPEAFFNTMVVNGNTWPIFTTAPALYRLRLLNGCSSRTLNLSMFVVTAGVDTIFGTADDVLDPLQEVPFYQIGGDQGFLPNVVKIVTGSYYPLPGNGTTPAATAAPDPSQALLMMPAERADVIVDFRAIPAGTRIRMINTAPDAPFGGLPDVAADPTTTGQVMDFYVNAAALPSDANTTPPENLVLPAEGNLGVASKTRPLSLNEMGSDQVCAEFDPTGAFVTVRYTVAPTDPAYPTFLATCQATPPLTVGNTVDAMGPREALLGVVVNDGMGNLSPLVKHWEDAITENPLLNSTEVWEFYNTTMDAHPIHLHLVRFEVIERQALDPATLMMGGLVPIGVATPALPNELGYKDTVVAYPGQVTRVKAKFDLAGLYVWHCHIIEHEDNEMMRPFFVGGAPAPTAVLVPSAASSSFKVSWTVAQAIAGVNYVVQEATDAAFSLNLRNVYTGPLTSVTVTGRTVGTTYYYRVKATSAGNPASVYTASANGCLVQPSATGVTLTQAPLGPTSAGSQLTFTATASGGSGSYEYKFLVKAPGALTSTVAQDYSSLNTCQWTAPATLGTYSIGVQARNLGSAAGAEAQRWITVQVATPPSSATLVASPTSPKVPGTVVTFTAGAIGGSGSYAYKFLVKAPGATTATIVQAYSSLKTFQWTAPATVGTYSIAVQVRNLASNATFEAQKWITYKVVAAAAPATGATLAASPAAPQAPGTAVTLTAGATGGSGTYEYKFLVKAPGATTATVLRTFATQKTFLWTAPATPGSYSLGVQIRNLGSNATLETQKWITYLVQ